MRRKDREISELGEIVSLIEGCDTLRVGFNDGPAPYIVPLSFGFELKDNALVFYVHGADVGRRHTLAARSGCVCVEADMCLGFTEDLTCDYRSFIGVGSIETVSGDEALHGLELLCRHCGYESMKCDRKLVDATCVEKIVVREFTAKQRYVRN